MRITVHNYLPARDINVFEHAFPREKEEKLRNESYKKHGIERVSDVDLNAAKLGKLLELYKAGFDDTTLGKMFGLSKSTLSQIFDMYESGYRPTNILAGIMGKSSRDYQAGLFTFGADVTFPNGEKQVRYVMAPDEAEAAKQFNTTFHTSKVGNIRKVNTGVPGKK